MKKYFIPLTVILFLVTAPGFKLQQQTETSFKTITIGNQTWMTENYSAPTQKSWVYDRDSIANKKYGRLYFWSNAMAAAPKGWHLPSLDEWTKLINNLGGDSTAALQLLDGGTSGLNLLFGGHRSANITPEEMFDLKDQFGYYWTSTQEGEQMAYAIELRKGVAYIVKNHFRRANGFSVRYVKDTK